MEELIEKTRSDFEENRSINPIKSGGMTVDRKEKRGKTRRGGNER
jgi:hypothetical protein